jgi:hypothetical protein
MNNNCKENFSYSEKILNISKIREEISPSRR